MEKLKFYEIEVEGIDKTGKDLLTHYIVLMSKYKYSVNTRGVLTQMVYNEKFNRKYKDTRMIGQVHKFFEIR